MGAVSMDQRAPVGPLAPGAKLGRYEILGKLAAGGMAIVYVARVQGVAGFERLVAIKVLHANLAHEDEFIHMFLDEARLAASIRHPNVVPTIDISDSEESGYFIVMEYIEGDHLGALLSGAHKADERLPLPIALRIVADALGGLGAAHDLADDTGKSLNLVHRDVSPHNIMVGRDGVVRLTDFGVAKAEDRLTHTRDGQVKGKLAYMAPEQAASGQTDLRSDLFSMGVILWECVTGQRLFRAETTGATLHKLLHDVIPAPSSVDPQLAPLDPLLARALAREPAVRFQTAEEFAQAIEEVAPALGGLSSLRGVARTVKQYTAAKLKREKKLIDDAVRALRPADAPELEPEVERETTSPSSTEISVSSGSLSASKVSGVFSHDTLPGTRRVITRTNHGLGPASAMRPAAPAASETDESIDVVMPRFSLPAVANEAGRRSLAPRGRRVLLWVLSGGILSAIAFWTLRPEHEDVRVGTMPALESNSANAAPASAASERAANPTVDPKSQREASPPAPPPPAAETSAPKSDETKLPVALPPLPDRAAAKREDPSKQPHRIIHHERLPEPAPREANVRSVPRTDVIPNPYHD